MPTTVQQFLADGIAAAAKELIEAYLRIPEEKRAWSPSESARSAVDQVAECALNNGITADLIRTQRWEDRPHEVYLQEKVRLASGDWESLKALFEKNTERVIATVREVPNDLLDVSVPTPYGNGPLSGIMAYPYWNMMYHQGQINYIATILGCY